MQLAVREAGAPGAERAPKELLSNHHRIPTNLPYNPSTTPRQPHDEAGDAQMKSIQIHKYTSIQRLIFKHWQVQLAVREAWAAGDQRAHIELL